MNNQWLLALLIVLYPFVVFGGVAFGAALAWRLMKPDGEKLFDRPPKPNDEETVA
ncbi:MAG TPA: hypothetical protein VMW52_12045 [Phycisphaerae bacterium]|nr:hypothetical protein [Phycisphaerae bacterium]